MFNRLTAPEPDWDSCAIYPKGVQPFFIAKGHGKFRWLREQGLIELKVEGCQDPLRPEIPPHRGDNGQPVAGNPGGKCDQDTYFYEDEVVRIDFYKSINEKKEQPGKLLKL